MESQIIDYYNDMPHGINVIDKMNDELEELQQKYNELNNKINKFKIPYKISNTIEEYNKYNNDIQIKFKNKIKSILLDEETGVEAMCSLTSDVGLLFYEKMVAFKFINGLEKYTWGNRKVTCIDKMIDELDILTNHKNKQWCRMRINTAMENLIDRLRYKEKDDYNDYFNYLYFIDFLIHFIFNDDNNDYLSELYIDMCNKITFDQNEILELLFCYGELNNCLNYMKCEKCGKLCNNIIDNKLDCLYCLG